MTHLNFESDDFLFYTAVQNAHCTFNCIMREFYLEYSGLVIIPAVSRSVQHPGEGGLDPGHPCGVPFWWGVGSAQPKSQHHFKFLKYSDKCLLASDFQLPSRQWDHCKPGKSRPPPHPTQPQTLAHATQSSPDLMKKT